MSSTNLSPSWIASGYSRKNRWIIGPSLLETIEVLLRPLIRGWPSSFGSSLPITFLSFLLVGEPCIEVVHGPLTVKALATSKVLPFCLKDIVGLLRIDNPCLLECVRKCLHFDHRSRVKAEGEGFEPSDLS